MAYSRRDDNRDRRSDDRDWRRSGGGSSSSLLLGLLGGSVLGAVGLGWWLLGEADRRRRQRGPAMALKIGRAHV